MAVSDEIGLGHVIRVQALFDAAELPLRHLWIWTDWSIDRVGALVEGRSVSTVELDAQSWPGGALPRSLVIDMPEPPRRLLEQTRGVPRKLLLGCSDDRRAWADLTVNVAEGGDLVQPEPAVGQRLWQGARFAQLRPVFLRGRCCPHDLQGPFLVAFGGTDAARLSLPVVTALLGAAEYAQHAVEAVIVPHHPDHDALQALAQSNSRFRLHHPSAQIAEWLQRATAAVVAPGNLLFECLALQTPALALAQNSRQSRDFAAYPWLMANVGVEELVPALAQLIGHERDAWFAYARQAAAGQSLHRLIDWCRAPIEDAVAMPTRR